jgi:hypothetical protein
MRRGTTSEWNDADPILNEGEIGYNSTLYSFKMGDGETVWSELDYYQAAASITPDEIGAIDSTEKNAADGVAILDGNKNVITALSVVFEGATENEFETLLTVTEPASDITLSLPNATDTLVGRATTDTLTNKSIAGSTNTISDIANSSLTNSAITINGTPVSLGGSITIAGDIESVTAGTGLTGGGTSGAVTLSIDTTVTADLTTAQTLSNKSISGATNTLTNIANNSLTNSSITVNGSSISLGGSATVTAVNPNALTIGTGLSGTSYDGSSAVTVAIDSSVATTSGTQTISNKSISLATNTLTGTIAEFNTALADADFATIAGAETLTNKTLTSPSVGTSLTTASTSFDLLNATATTINFGGAATVISIGAVTGTTTINDDLVVTGDLTVNGTTTTINSQTLSIEDKNIVLADANTSDVGADGGGITLKGATDKTFTWIDATDAWTSSEHMNLVSGKSYKINNTAISAALPALTWGEVKDGKSGLVIS